MSQTIAQFYESFKAELSLSKENDSFFKEEEHFTNLMFEYLKEAGEVEEPVLCSYRDNGIQISGFEFADDYSWLTIFVSIYSDTNSLISVPKSEVSAAQLRAFNIFKKATLGKVEQFKKDSDLAGLADRIFKNREKITNINIIALVNGTVKEMSSVPQKTFYGTANFNVWDMDRLYKCVTSGQQREPINVDFERYIGRPLTALRGGQSDKTTVYLAVVPGIFLANLYGDYRDKLLERNVRAYLQKKSSVNKGIIETIQLHPDLFLPYNNGITVTAAGVELGEDEEGTNRVLIKTINDFQIVNGGQTTVSLFAAKTDRTFESDFSNLYIQMKLVVVTSEAQMDELVPNISRFSNSQNKIQTADFASNDPYHRALEEKSRSIWSPAKDGKKPVQWFFERARGQYANAMNAEPTPSKRKEFKIYHPLLTKTDLAKVLLSWDCQPRTVALGSQKCFEKFMKDMDDEHRIVPNESYFKHCIAKTILFRSIERLVMQQKFGGYKANIVAYVYYKLMLITGKRIDLNAIWDSQDISEALANEIVGLSKVIQKYLVIDNNGVNVSEFSKSTACMEGVAELDYHLSPALASELLDKEIEEEFDTQPSANDFLSEGDKLIVDEAWAISANEWQKLGEWAKNQQKLDLWQRSTIFAMLSLKKRKIKPTLDQAKAVLEIREELINLGFKM